MLAKWITCDVPSGSRVAFAAAQRGWSVIADEPGLVCQVGGWDSRTGRAHVLALWVDRAGHRAFLRDRHDSVVSDGGCRDVEVVLGDVLFAMPGARPGVVPAGLTGGDVSLLTSGSGVVAAGTGVGDGVPSGSGGVLDVARAMGAGGVLRVADCRLAEGAEEHFVDVQRRVWAPAMNAAGMLGGVFVRLGAGRYLVVTSWPDVEVHRRYSERVLRLRELAGAVTDLTGSTGHVVPLEPTWRVVGNR